MIRKRIPKKKNCESITKHKIVRLPYAYLRTRNYPEQIHIEEPLLPRTERIISGEERAYIKIEKCKHKAEDLDCSRSESHDPEEPSPETTSERVNQRWRYLQNKIRNHVYESLDAKNIVNDVNCNSVSQIKSSRVDVILRQHKEARNPVLYLLRRQALKLKSFDDMMSRNKDTGMDGIDSTDSEGRKNK